MVEEKLAVEGSKYVIGIGRRKTSTAIVKLKEGLGRIFVNNKIYTEYFPTIQQRNNLLAPLECCNLLEKCDIDAKVVGGGVVGQSEAVALGIARALKKLSANYERLLRAGGYLTRDPRMKERRKYGFRGARRRPQWTKR